MPKHRTSARKLKSRRWKSRAHLWLYYKGAYTSAMDVALRGSEYMGGGCCTNGHRDESVIFKTPEAARAAAKKLTKISGVGWVEVIPDDGNGTRTTYKGAKKTMAKARKKKGKSRKHRTAAQKAATRKLVALNRKRAKGKSKPKTKKRGKSRKHRTAAQKAATRKLVALNRKRAKNKSKKRSKRKASKKRGAKKGGKKRHPGKHRASAACRQGFKEDLKAHGIGYASKELAACKRAEKLLKKRPTAAERRAAKEYERQRFLDANPREREYDF